MGRRWPGPQAESTRQHAGSDRGDRAGRELRSLRRFVLRALGPHSESRHGRMPAHCSGVRGRLQPVEAVPSGLWWRGTGTARGAIAAASFLSFAAWRLLGCADGRAHAMPG